MTTPTHSPPPVSSPQHLRQVVSTLGDLVAIDTSQPRPTLPLIKYAVKKLRGLGAQLKVSSGEKGAIFATVGPARAQDGIILSAHADVVAASPRDWKTPPFVMTRQGDLLRGRGTCDMKGFIACVLAALPHFNTPNLKRPVHFALSSDEEIGSLGMPDVLRLMRESGAKPSIALVGEPTRMRPVAGHKAGHEMRTVFRGVAAHSSVPSQGVSAVLEAARFAVFLDELTARMSGDAKPNSPFDPAHGVINSGVIRGGSARNVVAAECELEWHYRPLPGDDSGKILAEVESYLKSAEERMRDGGRHPNARIDNETESSYPGLAVDENSPALKLAQRLAGENDWTTAPYGTDAGHFQDAGISTAVIGPGDIAQAHKPDEFIEISELEKCAGFLESLRGELIRE